MVELIDLVKQGMELATAGDREDLHERLKQTHDRLLDPNIRVIVVGEFKQGKSKLINALVNAPVCPVDDDIATSVPTIVRYGKPAMASVLRHAQPSDAANATAGDTAGDTAEEEAPPERLYVRLNELADYVSENGNPGNERNLVSAEVRIPRKILFGGLSIIDSPGVGGLDSAHSLTTLTALPTADAMLLVSDASQEYTDPEMRFLRQAMRITPNVACVLTKTDLYPEWRRIEQLDRGHLEQVDPGISLFPVSSDLRLHATDTKDQELNVESGFPPLVRYLRQNILGEAERVQRKGVQQDLLSTAEHLLLSLETELRALEDPTSGPKMVAGLETAKQEASELRKRSARWQITLNDGAGDLIADMEHDLRERMRDLQREAEEAIDEGDPGAVWEEFSEWLEQGVSAAVSETFIWTNERARWLAEQVSAHFMQDQKSLPAIRVDDTENVLDPVEQMPTLDPGRVSPSQKVLIGMRGSYGGVLMFGLLTGIVGMALINPLSVGAGLLLGRKAYVEDKEARLKRRQAEAKVLVRRQIEEVVFQVGKQLKDRLRLVQRSTRDHFTEIAEEHHRSLGDSVIAAQKAEATYAAERDQRLQYLRLQIDQVSSLQTQARNLSEVPESAVAV